VAVVPVAWTAGVAVAAQAEVEVAVAARAAAADIQVAEATDAASLTGLGFGFFPLGPLPSVGAGLFLAGREMAEFASVWRHRQMKVNIIPVIGN